MNFEKAWNALVAVVAASNDYRDLKKSEIALVMLRCLADPDGVRAQIAAEKSKEDAA